ncbi:nucleotidyltransferase family protein [Lacihabitans sp. CCS-44]|uniref:nucleotidyltransferase family protein n=1 Tax=Lacihabitans sp. CCS-44 TaxID=2487331 RepID=UPI0020CE511A|nr:nucleotidyltransferase domain-containing protein [Lacihabitans sp. CCS-44]
MLPKLAELFVKHQVKNAFVFGSAVTEKFNNKSDVDFLVNLKENIDPVEAGEHLWDLQDELAELLKREVDLVTERSLKNPYFIDVLNQTKVAIYGQKD